MRMYSSDAQLCDLSCWVGPRVVENLTVRFVFQLWLLNSGLVINVCIEVSVYVRKIGWDKPTNHLLC